MWESAGKESFAEEVEAIESSKIRCHKRRQYISLPDALLAAIAALNTRSRAATIESLLEELSRAYPRLPPPSMVGFVISLERERQINNSGHAVRRARPDHCQWQCAQCATQIRSILCRCEQCRVDRQIIAVVGAL